MQYFVAVSCAHPERKKWAEKKEIPNKIHIYIAAERWNEKKISFNIPILFDDGDKKKEKKKTERSLRTSKTKWGSSSEAQFHWQKNKKKKNDFQKRKKMPIKRRVT